MKSAYPPFVILGCGYTGTRLAQSLLADGAQVRVCARRVALLEPLRALGAELHYIEASRSQQFGPAMLGLDQPVVIYSIPGVPDLPQGEAVRRAATAAQRVHARAFVYLGSSGVYGRSEGNSNEEWVDEDSMVAAGDPDASGRLAEEAALASVAQGGLTAVLLRLSAIYGPGLSQHLPARGVRPRLRSGQYKLWDGGRYFFSRIHVDDLVRVIRAAAMRAVRVGSGNPSALYVVGDDHPCQQAEYVSWLCQHLNLPPPPGADSHLSRGPGHAIRGRRLSNAKLKRELGIELLYPSFREGEAQIDAWEQSGVLPPLGPSSAEPATVVPTASVPTAAVAPSPVSLPPLPLAESGTDFAVLLGGAPVGASLLLLAPGQRADPGRIYLVLSGALTVQRNGQSQPAGPRSLVPATATLFNSGNTVAELVAILPPR